MRRQIERVVFGDEADRNAGGAGAAGAADAVHVVFRIFRQIEVDHVADVVDMDAAPGNVGCNEHADFALFESIERRQAFALRHFARQHFARDVFPAQIFVQVARRVAAVREHHHARQRFRFAPSRRAACLCSRPTTSQNFCSTESTATFSGSIATCTGSSVHDVREPHHVVIERRAEEQRLAFAFVRRLVDDAAHVGNETHVEHAIGFVDHEHFHAAEIDDAPVDEVEQSARRRDENVDRTFGQLQALFVEVHAADDADDDRVQVFREVAYRPVRSGSRVPASARAPARAACRAGSAGDFGCSH